jgi:hypothetical protein
VAALRVAAVVLIAGVMTAGADGARAALFFFFEPTAAKPGDRITIRTAWTPKSFQPRERVKPFQRPMRLYLVPNSFAGEIHSRFDPRAHYIGTLRPDNRGRGVLTFTTPPLESGSYAAAAWCPACAPHSRGRAWSVVGLGPSVVTRYRPRMLLRVHAPPATSDSCPTTMPNGSTPPGLQPRPWRHGNGLLWTSLPRDGTAELDPERVSPDGSIFWTKLIWIARGVYAGGLEVEIKRLDAPAPVLRPDVVSGHLSGWSGPSWAARMRFSSEGCWKVTGRVDDVSLSFVLKAERL